MFTIDADALFMNSSVTLEHLAALMGEKSIIVASDTTISNTAQVADVFRRSFIAFHRADLASVACHFVVDNALARAPVCD